MKEQRGRRILAFYAHARGYAYVLVEGFDHPIDWAMSDVRKGRKLPSLLPRLDRLLEQTSPDVLVLRATEESQSRLRSAKLLRAMSELAKTKGIPTVPISRKQIRRTFAHLASPHRQAIADDIARAIPWLKWFAPPRRKIWNGEDRRMGLFDAAALALTFAQGANDDRLRSLPA